MHRGDIIDCRTVVRFIPWLNTEQKPCAFCSVLTPCRSDTMWSGLEAALFRAGVFLVFHLFELRTQGVGEVTEGSTTRGSSFAFRICTVGKCGIVEGYNGGGRYCSCYHLEQPTVGKVRGVTRCRRLLSCGSHPYRAVYARNQTPHQVRINHCQYCQCRILLVSGPLCTKHRALCTKKN